MKTSNFREITTLQYMGSKTRILNDVCTPIIENDSIATVIDLFAGTGSIGYAMLPFNSVVSNDLEYYAYIVNEGILNGCNLPQSSRDEFACDTEELIRTLRGKCKAAITEESRFFTVGESHYEEYKRFCEETPSIVNPDTENGSLKCVSNLIADLKCKRIHKSLPVLFITYYSNTYFGINQCCEIDAIRGAISNVGNQRIRNVLLTALMSAMSSTASTTTHFAQYLKVNSASTCKNLLEKRSQSIFQLMMEKLDEFDAKGLLSIEVPTARCTNLDYMDLLHEYPLDDTVMVYADPPYFKEHYSRYYHVLNTLCRYDYPQIAINPQTHEYSIGRYRQDRNTSDFGKKGTALAAFRKMISLCADSNAWITISYSDNSIVRIADITTEMNQHYSVEIKTISLKHSKQGRESNSCVNEYLFIGRPRTCRVSIGQKQIIESLNQLATIKPVVDNPAGFMQNYMARKPYNIVNAIINDLCPNDGIVYDPMAGSGTTLIEASKLGVRSIGTDINPLAYKLMKVSLRKWNMSKVDTVVSKFVDDVSTACANLYCIDTGNSEPKIIERCHFDRINGSLIPTEYWCKRVIPGGLSGRYRMVADKDFVTDYNALANYCATNISDTPLIPNSRIAIKQNDSVYKYFCNRNLIAVDRILQVLKKYRGNYCYSILQLLVSSSLNLVKLSDKKASSQMPYWIPQKGITSRNAVFIIKDKAEKILDGLKYLENYCALKEVSTYKELLDEKGVLIKDVPAQHMSPQVLPANSVDLVLTDPPYTDQVPYLEYSQLWSHILGWDHKQQQRYVTELVVSDAPSRAKGKEDFSLVFEAILKRTAKALKYKGLFVMFYHSFDLASWNQILLTMKKYGLLYQGQAPIAAPRKSFKAIMSPNSTLDGNYVIVFQKRSSKQPAFAGSINDAVLSVEDCARRIIRTDEAITTQALYDNGLLKDAVEKGYLELIAQKYSTFTQILQAHFVCVDGIWREK